MDLTAKELHGTFLLVDSCSNPTIHLRLTVRGRGPPGYSHPKIVGVISRLFLSGKSIIEIGE